MPRKLGLQPGVVKVQPPVRIGLIALLLLFFPGVEGAVPKEQRDVIRYGYRIIQTYPHDPGAFTQGLIFHGGYLYESTGLQGRSSLRKVDLETGRIEKIHHLAKEHFGEGLTVYRNRLYQLTWRSRIGFIYDIDTFQEVGRFTYDSEGWGLTSDGKHLIMSDGSSQLRFLDTRTFKVVKTLSVQLQGRPLKNLNELEYIKGDIYANIWNTSVIARISPHHGLVTGWIDLDGLEAYFGRDARIDVLNGIAYDHEKNRLFITGKLWPRLFEIELIPARDGEKRPKR